MGPAVQTWSNAVTQSLMDLWVRFAAFLPNLIGAIIIFVVGWIIAITLGKVVARILETLKIDTGVERLGLKKGLAKSGIKVDVAAFLGELTKWFLIIVFLMAATDVIGLTQVSDFLNDVLMYLPQIIVAAIILIVAVLLANFVARVIKDSIRATGLLSGSTVATLAKWAILIFAVLAALVQLNVAKDMIMVVFQGLIAMLAIAGGLAFGLGGRDAAEALIDNAQKELKK